MAKIDCRLKKLAFILLIIILFIKIFHIYNRHFRKSDILENVDLNFEYNKYQKNIVTDDVYNKSQCMLSRNNAYFLNGIIRKHSPKNCLEIGVSKGGSSIIILNALKDIKGSRLVSLDLNTNYFKDHTKKTGWRVKKFFPHLTKNWSLYTGNQPHKFLMKLNMKFDFLFLDTAHHTPGEIINIIEVMPFLNENAIIVLHDIIFHCSKLRQKNELDAKINNPNFQLMTFLYGDKIILKTSNKTVDNIGAIFLYKNQKNHYQEYFFSLISVWDYMPSERQLNDLKYFIVKYYKDDSLLEIFNQAVRFNKAFYKKFKKTI